MTESLTQELFSDIDPHKKGHLTLEDWINAFSKKFILYNYFFRRIQLEKLND